MRAPARVSLRAVTDRVVALPRRALAGSAAGKALEALTLAGLVLLVPRALGPADYGGFAVALAVATGIATATGIGGPALFARVLAPLHGAGRGDVARTLALRVGRTRLLMLAGAGRGGGRGGAAGAGPRQLPAGRARRGGRAVRRRRLAALPARPRPRADGRVEPALSARERGHRRGRAAAVPGVRARRRDRGARDRRRGGARAGAREHVVRPCATRVPARRCRTTRCASRGCRPPAAR